jgi:hypothetical protein
LNEALDFAEVGNIGERMRADHYQIGALAGFDGAGFFL